MANIQDLMNAISNMEGFNVSGSIAQRNNNPGNLRYAPTQIGSENTASGTFASFSDPNSGWSALQDYINNNSGMSLRDFIYKYAPPTENDTSNYLNYVAGQLGVSNVDQSIGSIFGNSQVPNSDISNSLDTMASNFGSGIDLTDPTTLGVIAIVGIGLVASFMRS